MESDYTDYEGVVIRNLRSEDCPRLVAIDEKLTGRSRRMWYEGKLRRALEDSDLQVSLGAEVDDLLVGAMFAAVHYGEFGQPDPLAVLDTVLVDPAFAGRGIARAIFEQLLRNLTALRIERLRTEVAWNDHELVAFFGSMGFEPTARLVLETEISPD